MAQFVFSFSLAQEMEIEVKTAVTVISNQRQFSMVYTLIDQKTEITSYRLVVSPPSLNIKTLEIIKVLSIC